MIDMKVNPEEKCLIEYLRELKYGEVTLEIINSLPKKGFRAKKPIEWIRFDQNQVS